MISVDESRKECKHTEKNYLTQGARGKNLERLSEEKGASLPCFSPEKGKHRGLMPTLPARIRGSQTSVAQSRCPSTSPGPAGNPAGRRASQRKAMALALPEGVASWVRPRRSGVSHQRDPGSSQRLRRTPEVREGQPYRRPTLTTTPVGSREFGHPSSLRQMRTPSGSSCPGLHGSRRPNQATEAKSSTRPLRVQAGREWACFPGCGLPGEPPGPRGSSPAGLKASAFSGRNRRTHAHTPTLTHTTLRQLLHLELTDVQGNSSMPPVQLRPHVRVGLFPARLRAAA